MSSPVTETTRDDVAGRCLAAVTIGTALGLLWVLTNRLFTSGALCKGEGIDCLAVALLAYPLFLGGIVIVGVVFLAYTKLPRNWLIAVTGPAAVILIFKLVTWLGLGADATFVLATALAYLIAAFVTAQATPASWRIGVGLATVALLPLGNLIAPAQWW
jgi:hypothetical protein